MAETPDSPVSDTPESATTASEPPVVETSVVETPVTDTHEETPAAPAPEPILEVLATEVTAFSETVSESVGETVSAIEAVAAQAVTAEVAAVDSGEPRVAATLEVAPLPATDTGAGPGGEGGEWDLLVGKAKRWLEDADLPGQWERLGGPLRGLGVLLGLLVVLKLYVALLDTLDDLPLLPRLLQLVGLIALLRFSVTRLTRSSDRQTILNDWKRRWDAFRGA
jgi:hypothetical protein